MWDCRVVVKCLGGVLAFRANDPFEGQCVHVFSVPLIAVGTYAGRMVSLECLLGK